MNGSKCWVAAGAIFAGLAVIIGAFGAHALRERLPERAMQIYQTGNHYQFIHALGLILLGCWMATPSGGSARVAGLTAATGWLFVVGTFLFSGSLYALALSDIKILGAITPFGGLSWIAGWACFAWAALRG